MCKDCAYSEYLYDYFNGEPLGIVCEKKGNNILIGFNDNVPNWCPKEEEK